MKEEFEEREREATSVVKTAINGIFFCGLNIVICPVKMNAGLYLRGVCRRWH
jgi:hypothetical protein